MNAWANQGAWINLEFGLDTDMQKTLIEVISRMNRVPPLPRDALSPNIMLAGSGGDAPALTSRLHNPNEINTYVTFLPMSLNLSLNPSRALQGRVWKAGLAALRSFKLFSPV